MATHDAVKSLHGDAHRLPTVPASHALLHLKSHGPTALPTGVRHLDAILCGQDVSLDKNPHVTGGFLPGQVAEIWGPPGVGKTTIALRACASALKAGKTVVWVDASSNVVLSRLREMISATMRSADPTAPSDNPDVLLRKLHHYDTPSLPHLLALFTHAPALFPPQEAALVVIDDVSIVFDNAYPRNAADYSSTSRSEAAKWTAGRRHGVIGKFIAQLAKMAALGDFTVLITSQTVTRVRAEGGALLLPAVSSSEWESNISTQIALFRDWRPMHRGSAEQEHDDLCRIRFASVQKAAGVMIADDSSIGHVVPFSISANGVEEISLGSSELPLAPLSSPVKARKRPHTEVADSEGSDEDYGWLAEDEVATEGLIDERHLIIDLTRTRREESTPS